MLDRYQTPATRVPVENDIENLERMGLKVIGTDLLRMSGQSTRKNPPRSRRHRRGGTGTGAARAPRETETLIMNTTVVILAAGLGTRMRSKRAKVLHRAGGCRWWSTWCGRRAPSLRPTDIVVVTGHRPRTWKRCSRPWASASCARAEQKGTGHALACCRAARVDTQDGLLMVLYGDTPLLSAATLTRLRDHQANSDAAATLITTTLDDPSGYGRVILDANGNVTAIVEHKACTPGTDVRFASINSGIYCFRAELLWKHIGEIKPNNASRRTVPHRHGGDPRPPRPPRAAHARRRSERAAGHQHAHRTRRRRPHPAPPQDPTS